MGMFDNFLDKKAEIFFKPVITLVAGGVAAKAIGFAAIPFITRLYGPEQMGILSSYIAFVAILAPLGTLRYVTALPVPRTGVAAANLLALNLIILIGATFLLSLLIWAGGGWILSAFSFSELEPFLYLIAAGVFFSGFYEIFSLWGTRSRAYKTLAASQAWQALIGSSVKIVLGIIGFKAIGLIMGQLGQQIGGVIPLTKICYAETACYRRSISLARIAKVAYCFADMPRYRLPSHILLMAAMQGPLLLTAYIYGMAEAGQLGLAITALALPLSVLGGAAGNAYFAEISALGRGESKKILAITKSITVKLFLLSLLPALTLMTAGPWIFSVVFGADWVMAGEFARVLSVYLVFQFISSPLGNALTLYRRQDLFFKMNLVRFIMVVLVFSSAGKFGWGSTSTILAYSLSLSAHYFFSNRIIFHIIKVSAGEVKVS